MASNRPSPKTCMIKRHIPTLENELEIADIILEAGRNDQVVYDALYYGVDNHVHPEVISHICDQLEILIDNNARQALEQFQQSHPEEHFLRKLNQCWREHCSKIHMIKSIFLKLDKRNIKSISELGTARFRHYFSENRAIHKRTIDEVLDLIQQERSGGYIDRIQVKDILTMLSNLTLYRETFEQQFLEETVRFFNTEGQKLANEKDVPEYLKYVSKVIKDETERSSSYLDKLTKEPLTAAVERELISNHLSLILSKGLDQLLDDMRMPELILMHTLLSRVQTGLNELCSHFNKHIKKRGEVIVLNVNQDKTMVQDLLVFKERMDRVVNDCFQKQERFINSLKEAFECFINKRSNKPAELIAKFLDSKLKSGNKEATEDELEKILDQILVLFRFIHGKDVFEAFYKKDLAKRLLVNKSASVDAEKSMLSKLKQECGAQFTSKLEGMFRDIEHSKDLMTAFKNHLIAHPVANPVDMQVNVLTMSYWPSYQPMDVELPGFLQDHQSAFDKFYKQKHTGRKLQWQPILGQCVLIAVFGTKQHELLVSQDQGIVLLLFNERDLISYNEILTTTKIEPVELKRTLQSLACGKVRVLSKIPKGKEIEESDSFEFNSKFTSSLYRIRINQVQLKETNEEKTMTEERVFQDRQYQIDAAIVRIMKTRKSLNHNTLVAQVFEQLRFPVKAYDVKLRIESLIDRDYIQRDQDDATQYNYVS